MFKNLTTPPRTSKICLIFLSLVFTVCVALGIYFILPKTTATALADEFSHTYADSHPEGTWTKLTTELVDSTEDGKTAGYIVGTTTEGGATYYFLNEDVTLNNNITISGNVVLCLNGNMLTGTGSGSVISISEGATLILCDCQEGKAENTVTVYTYRSGSTTEETFDSGVITGGTGEYNFSSYRSDGGGVEVLVGGTFEMYGGTIAGNTAADGAGVYVGGTFYMYGGTISGNSASEDGGGVRLSGNDTNTFIMYGGTITGNSAIYAGGVFGEFTMYGGTIAGNNSHGVYGSITMYGGYLDGVIARSSGGTVSIYGGALSQEAYTSVYDTDNDINYIDDDSVAIATTDSTWAYVVIPEEYNNASYISTVAPTCTEEGTTAYTYKIEEQEYTLTINPAVTGHSYENGVCTVCNTECAHDYADGLCTVCGAEEPNEGGLSGGAIAGIVIGSVLGALIIAYAVGAILFKKGIITGAFFSKIYPFIK